MIIPIFRLHLPPRSSLSEAKQLPRVKLDKFFQHGYQREETKTFEGLTQTVRFCYPEIIVSENLIGYQEGPSQNLPNLLIWKPTLQIVHQLSSLVSICFFLGGGSLSPQDTEERELSSEQLGKAGWLRVHGPKVQVTLTVNSSSPNLTFQSQLPGVLEGSYTPTQYPTFQGTSNRIIRKEYNGVFLSKYSISRFTLRISQDNLRWRKWHIISNQRHGTTGYRTATQNGRR